jgi:cobalamin biosynthesis Mg chelatase CobN
VTQAPKCRAPKCTLRVVVLAGVLLLALGAQASAASAAPPCWKSLLTDWYDGTIDKTYPIPCYRQAVDQLPTDAQLYTSAKDDILRAMASAIAAQKPATTPTTTAAPPTTTAPATTATQPAETTTQVTTEATTTNAESVPPVTTTTSSPGRPKPKGIARALDKLNPGEADSFPLPLLILGALAILLVGAGVVGMIWRRMDRGDASTP